MSQDSRHILWAQEDHPSTELLRQYQEDTLPAALHHQLERHLLDCTLCSDVLEGMVISDAGKTKAAVRHINQHITAKTRKKKRKPLPVYLTDWRVAAALFLVLCSTLLVFYYNYKEISQQEQPIASEADKALNESMDLSQAPAASVPEPMDQAVPDTLKPTIAAAPAPPRARIRRKPLPTAVVPETPNIISADATPEAEVQEEKRAELAAAPAVTEAVAPTAAPSSMANQAKSHFDPESTFVAGALAGKAAGMSIKGRNYVAMKQVQGQVLSSEGQPLAGVTVTVKGSQTGVSTDAQGNFSLNLPADKATLAFNYIGYEREEKVVDAGTQQLTVNLQEDTRSLSEVVVVGYGKAKTSAPVVVAAKPGVGVKAYRKYLDENIRYTSDSKKGRVVVQATVSPAGTLQNLQVIKSLCPSCDEEALRLIKEGPAWKPATSSGNSVEQSVKIVVRFNREK